MYSLWMQRNKRKHGEQQTPLSSAVKWSIDMAFDLWELSRPKKGALTTSKKRWQPPPMGWIKCNIDGAFDPTQGQGATAAVLRDERGSFQGGRAQWYSHGLDALMMESLACRDGMAYARERGVRRLLVETDNQELVKLWEAGANQRSNVAAFIKECRDISLCFPDFRIAFSPRSCNRVADMLAKQISGTNSLAVWHSAPACVGNLLIDDRNLVVP